MLKVHDPSRGDYRKKIKSINDKCLFCDAKIIKNQTCHNLEGLHWVVMVNKFPYMDGNLMIIPKRHVEAIEDLNLEEQAEFFLILAKTKKIIGKLFKTESFNVSLNLGENSGGSIKHLHWQMIPRPRKENFNAINIFSDIYVITVSPLDLKKKIENFGKK